MLREGTATRVSDQSLGRTNGENIRSLLGAHTLGVWDPGVRAHSFFFFWLRWVFVAVRRLSLVAASGGLLFVVVRGLLIAMASLVAEPGL